MDSALTRNILTSILRRFSVTDKLTDHTPIIEYNNGKGVMKYVVRVNTESGKSYICKISRESRKYKRTIEDQCAFSEYLRQNGIKTPHHYTCSGKYRIDFKIGSHTANVTLEDYIGEEVTLMTPELSFSLGVLLGKMHSLSEKGRCHIHRGETIFNLVGYNEVNEYDLLRRLDRERKLPHDIFLRIRRAYRRIYRRMEELYPSLPTFAVQGDISINNLTLSDGVLGIFDYNISGDVALVSDLILNGLLNAYEMDYPDGVTDRDIYDAYERGYFSVRTLTTAEEELYRIALPMSRALWFGHVGPYFNGTESPLSEEKYAEMKQKLADIACELEKCSL